MDIGRKQVHSSANLSQISIVWAIDVEPLTQFKRSTIIIQFQAEKDSSSHFQSATELTLLSFAVWLGESEKLHFFLWIKFLTPV